MSDSIDFDAGALEAATNWHGGQSSMLYAISSTGSLKRGTIRPRNEECEHCYGRHWVGGPSDGYTCRCVSQGTAYMSDAEWLAHLASKLESETESAIKDCELLIEKSGDDTRDGLLDELEGLQSILSSIEEWRSANKDPK